MKDREKEFRERVKCGIAYCEDPPFNENKEKQIEEMAQYLKGYLFPLDNNSIENCRVLASALVYSGWVKLLEGSVVFSKEEYAELQKLDDKQNEELRTLRRQVEYWKERTGMWKQASYDIRNETAIKFYDKFNENIRCFKLENKSEDYKEGYIQAIADICGKLDKTAVELGVDLEGYYGKL